MTEHLCVGMGKKFVKWVLRILWYIFRKFIHTLIYVSISIWSSLSYILLVCRNLLFKCLIIAHKLIIDTVYNNYNNGIKKWEKLLLFTFFTNPESASSLFSSFCFNVSIVKLSPSASTVPACRNRKVNLI